MTRDRDAIRAAFEEYRKRWPDGEEDEGMVVEGAYAGAVAMCVPALLDDCDALAGALRELVGFVDGLPLHTPMTPNQLAAAALGVGDAEALLDRLGYGAGEGEG